MELYIILGIVILILLYIFITYNSLIKLKHKVEEAFATMDVYLKKRWDLVPNLVETVKGYAKHENDTLKEVIELRNTTYDNLKVNDKVDVSEKMNQNITKLMALAENYPDLKADKNFRQLSDELIKIEDEIANSRKYYNAVVRLNNNKVEMFPSNIVAKLFGCKEYNMFEAKSSERENQKVEL